MMEGSGCADSTSAPLPDSWRHPCRVVTRPCEPPSSASRSPRSPSPGAPRAERRPAARASAPRRRGLHHARQAHDRHRRARVLPLRDRRRPRVAARASRPRSPTRSPTSSASQPMTSSGCARRFEAAIAPGPKTFDFNIQQYSITDERKQNVDFSSPYYAASQAIVAIEGSRRRGRDDARRSEGPPARSAWSAPRARRRSTRS